MLSISILVYAKRRNDRISRIFVLFPSAAFIWLLFSSITYSVDDIRVAQFLMNISYTGVILILPAFLHFTCYFLNLDKLKKTIIPFYIFNFINIYLLYSTNYFINGLYKYFWGYYPRAGIMHPVFLVVFFVFLAILIFSLFREWLKLRNKESILKYRAQYLAFAFFVMSFSVVDYIPNYGIEIYPFGWIPVIGFCSVMTYAILKYQLMDIKIVIQKALIYSLGIALITGLMMVAVFLSNWFEGKIPGFQFWMVPLAIGATAFVLGKLFYNKSQEADKLKYEFITVAAHKLRTPLTKIKWAGSTLKDKTIEENEREKLVSHILDADNSLIELTNELLDVAKTEAGKYQYKLEPANLEKIVRKVVNVSASSEREKY
jgi:hypothetical protein